MGVAYSGTPWSGQAVKWNWVTFRARSELPVSCAVENTHRDGTCSAIWNIYRDGIVVIEHIYAEMACVAL